MNLVRHIVLSAAVIFAAADTAFSQSYSISPNDTIIVTGVFEDLETITISQLNISGDTISLQWAKVSESVPALWEASICDNKLCNTTLADSGTMNPVFPGDMGFLLLHITAHLNTGTAIVRYAVWDSTNVAIKDTITFIFKVLNTSGISEAVNENELTIFPDPFNQQLTIASELLSDFHVLITDISGKSIYAGDSVGSTMNLTTRAIPKGVYILLISKNNKIISTKKLILSH